VPRMRKGLFLKGFTYALILGFWLIAAADDLWCQNRAPAFDPTAICLVSGPDVGESLFGGGSTEGGTFTTCHVPEKRAIEVRVRARDADGDPISMSVMNAPPTALFDDHTDGTASLLWIPDFIGPWSSARSPFTLFFVASDGSASSQLRVVINVINVNRDPELISPESLEVAAGNELVFQVRASDPDLEKVTVEVLEPPPGAGFDPQLGIFTWRPEPADTGLWPVTFRAIDNSGGDGLSQTRIRVAPPSSFSISLGVDECILGGVADIPVNLANPDPVAGMELLIRYDPTVLVFLEASRQSAGTRDWEYFHYRDEPVGLYRQVKIVGIADFPNQVRIPPLAPDSGTIAHLRFKVTNDPNFSGLLIPIEFYSFDFSDNTLSTPQGRFIPQERASLSNGGALLYEGSTLIGDINQNGLAYEVGDAVKLAAYLSDRTDLTPQQKINADINQDGRMATLTDLVLLIQRIIQQDLVPGGDDVDSEGIAVARITREASRTSISLESESEVGCALVIFKGQDVQIENVELAPRASDLDLHTHRSGNEFRVLVIGPEADPLPLDDCLFSLKGDGFDAIQVSLADCEGELLQVKKEYEKVSLPTRFALHQNHPNPFNPSTSIRYTVGTDHPVKVSLRIYNITGQLVKTLVDEEKSPGEHQEIWTGKNEEGHDVASGVYFYRLEVPEYSKSRRMVLLK
jgi:hypothetical protein